MKKEILAVLVVVILVVIVGLVVLAVPPAPSGRVTEIKEIMASSGDKVKLCVGQSAKIDDYTVKLMSANPLQFKVSLFGNERTVVGEPGFAYYVMLLKLGIANASDDCAVVELVDEYEEVDPKEFEIPFSSPVEVKGTDIKIGVFFDTVYGSLLQIVGNGKLIEEQAVPNQNITVGDFVVHYVGFLVEESGLHKFNVYKEVD